MPALLDGRDKIVSVFHQLFKLTMEEEHIEKEDEIPRLPPNPNSHKSTLSYIFQLVKDDFLYNPLFYKYAAGWAIFWGSLHLFTHKIYYPKIMHPFQSHLLKKAVENSVPNYSIKSHPKIVIPSSNSLKKTWKYSALTANRLFSFTHSLIWHKNIDFR